MYEVNYNVMMCAIVSTVVLDRKVENDTVTATAVKPRLPR